MPVKSKRPCTYPGCGVLTTSGRCDQHKRAEQKVYDKQRGTAHARGYGYKWQQYSKRFRRDHPLCADCLKTGKLTSVEHGGHVDHIQAVTGPDDPMFWEPSNHQSLCGYHHRVKSVREDGALVGAELKALC